MQIRVESHLNTDGLPMARTVWFDGRHVHVEEILDQWYGADHRYIKIRGYDGGLYILRFDQIRKTWELTMFACAQATAL